MAGKGAVLAIRIISDASGASRGFDQASGRVQKFERGLDRASGAATGVLAAVGAVAAKAYADASALEQSAGAIESVYGKHAGAIRKQAEAAADAVGLSQNAYQELSSVVGAQLKGMGYAGKELTDQNQSLIQTGADLAATFGGSTSDAVSALSSLMRGERDPIEKYGIAINAAGVKAQVAAMGLDTSTPAAKRAAEAQATLALVAQQSAGAQGAFAREADTAAGQTERAKAAFENASAQLGTVLLPIVTAGAKKLAAFAGWLVANKAAVLPLVGVIAGLAGAVLAVNGAMKAYRAAMMAARAAQIVLNIAMAANPLGLIVLAIAAVIAGVVLAYHKFEWFRDFVQGVGRAIASAFDAVMGAIEWVIDKLSFVGDAASAVGGLFDASATVSVVPQAGGSLAGMFGAVAGPAPVGVYGAGMSAPGGGGSTSARGSRRAPTQVVNITVTGAIDPIGTARQIRKLLDSESTITGRSMTLVTR